ncbi:MAG: hypothetical protein PUF74_07665 [Sodaliphilus pleomorphus]|uniref:hypothetical protein n=1 Tax=Sodaliphilus pleomorphus TaxID=2606626 RepID=UPI00240A295A|nr:hypothetical protein [Sodaliphilus pleomorphus]MDD6475381.1 hypothetical protein [Sodaliphilus pleomorphus]
MIALHLLELNESSWIYSIIGTALKKVRDSISIMDSRTETFFPQQRAEQSPQPPPAPHFYKAGACNHAGTCLEIITPTVTAVPALHNNHTVKQLRKTPQQAAPTMIGDIDGKKSVL